MKYLQMYCDTFGLKIKENRIFDDQNNLIGMIEDDKYIQFTYQKSPVKMSDLLLAAFEQISVH